MENKRFETVILRRFGTRGLIIVKTDPIEEYVSDETQLLTLISKYNDLGYMVTAIENFTNENCVVVMTRGYYDE